MTSWGFLTTRAQVLVCIARDPGVRLRDIAASLGITERSAHGIVTDLAAAGYVVKQRDGRRNRYQIQATSRCQNPLAGAALSARCWTSSPAPARRSEATRITEARRTGVPTVRQMRPTGLPGTAVSAVALHEHIRHQKASDKKRHEEDHHSRGRATGLLVAAAAARPRRGRQRAPGRHIRLCRSNNRLSG